MKKTLATTVALAACLSTQVFGQNTKEDVITFSLTAQNQTSVSDSTAQNHGTWEAPPTHYKTGTKKLTQADLIKAIAIVTHHNAGYYGTTAKLVLVQGELTGFFNVTPDLEASTENLVAANDLLDGTFTTSDGDFNTSIANSFDSTYLTFANGRHFEVNPNNETFYPVGHMQPWGQIYVKFINPTTKALDCENVTYFFGITVQECYDCFYMNSFISDATFTKKTTTGPQNGPPCCNVDSSTVWLGNGKDRYYMTLSFDNTVNNPYLDPTMDDGGFYVQPGGAPSTYVGVTGLSDLIADGIHPDLGDYVSPILSRLGSPSPYEARFTLNGIVTYTWKLNWLNKTDISPDFIGNATYAANGYGFIQLYCTLLTGTVNFSEKMVKTTTCCTGEPWYDSWYGVGHYNNDGYAEGNSNAFFDEAMSFTPSTPFNVGPSLSYHANFNEEYTPLRTHDEW